MNTINLNPKIVVSLCRCVKFLIIPFLFLACQNQATKQKTVTASTSPEKVQTVGVIQPKTQSFTSNTLITGIAQPNQKTMVYAMESGYVKSIQKDIGDKVQKGAIIAQLDNPTISQVLSDAQANIKIAEANLSTAQAELKAAQADAKGKQSIYDRLNGVYQKTPQLTTVMDVENSEAATLMAKATVDTKQAMIQAQQSKIAAFQQQLNIAQQRYSRLNVKAPFSGIITQRMVDVGAMVQSGLTESTPMGIVEIQETNPIRLTIPMPESDATAVQKGMDVTVTFPELPDASYTTKISRTSGALDPISKTMRVEIDIPNADGKILTGMYAKAEMQLGSRNDVLALPNTAQVLYEDAPTVLAVKDGKVERIPLRIGLRGKDYFEVLNPEITKETQVIVEGKSLVKIGQVVEAIIKK